METLLFADCEKAREVEPNMNIRLKRVYAPAEEEDGYRVLVDRLWPRGVSKEKAQVDLWLRDAGVGTSLRRWFGHDPARWDEFRHRYFAELRKRPEVLEELRGVLRTHPVVTFLYAARDEEHNNAVALREFVEDEG
jgi:uncharacterized protein YeaO (DUF488 family)